MRRGHHALYRVYNVLGEPRFFALEGDITHVLELTPMIYTAQITASAPADSTRRGVSASDGRTAVQQRK